MNRGLPDWLALMGPDYVPAPIPGDPYFPDLLPAAPADLSDPEEDPSEDEVEQDPIEDTDDEDIFEDAQRVDDTEESLTEEDIPEAPLSPPRVIIPPYLSRGKGLLMRKTARKSVFPMSGLEDFGVTTQPSGGLVGGSTHEQGESSQVPPTDYQTSQIGRLAKRVRLLEELQGATASAAYTVERRVKTLEEEEEDDAQAIQILYHRSGASRTEAITTGAQIQALQHRVHITETRLDAAEHHAREAGRRALVAERERLRMQEKLNEILSYLATRKSP